MDKVLQPWAIGGDEVLSVLETSHKGLGDEEAAKRLAHFGSNTFHSKEKKGIITTFLKQFVSPLIFLLLGAGVLTLILQEWVDTAVIFFAVLLNVSLGFYHEHHAETTLDNLTTYIKDRARVIRGGREEEIDSSLLVPGDVIKLSYGTRVPADARILSLNNFRVDEAILTGESIPVEKILEPIALTSLLSDQKNIAHAGTLIVEGYASAVVYATGADTEIGKIAGIVSKIERTETPLQRGVDKLAWLIFFLVMGIVMVILVLGILRGISLLPMLLLASAVAVGAVPEALPIVLTVILAIGATRIASKKGIVRKLTAAETLGSTTLIMTDKTGTLTLADMQLVGIHGTHEILKETTVTALNSFSPEQKELLRLALLNVDVSIENPMEDQDTWTFRGRPFEVNIAKASRLHSVSLDAVKANENFLVLPFNSTNKFSVALKDDVYTVMGAPDILLKKSDLSKEDFLKLEAWIEKTSREGKRLIGIANFNKAKGEEFSLEQVDKLEFLGLLAFYDPIRPEVPEAIKNIESHGIKIVLVTGDLVGTALSVAKSLNFEVKEDEVLLGSELRALSDTELTDVIKRIKIFARVTPEDKLRIGKAYQALGEVVAMTGDGVNDAPALKAMDIGISLGSASDVAKSAADLVLLDDNFHTISMAIDEGRRILSNIRKSFVYLMSTSLDEVFVVGGSLVMGLTMPLTALQIIWVNLFTGSLPALSFAFDEDLDREKYKGRDLRLIFTGEVKVLTLAIGILSALLTFLLYIFLIRIGLEIGLVRSIFFVCFSSYTLAATYSFRSLHKPLFSYSAFSNPKLNLSLLISATILVLTMAVPAIRNIFGIDPLPLSWIPFVVLWLILNILLVEAIKFTLRKRHHIRSLFYHQRKG